MSNAKRRRVLVASPIYNDQCYGSYTGSLLNLQKMLLESGCEFTFHWTKSISRISVARNILLGRFLEDEAATHLLFIDADMAFEAADVVKMLDYDHEIMAALYPKKAINWERVIKAVRENPDIPEEKLPLIAGHFGTLHFLPGQKTVPGDRPFLIDAAGTGIMLIRRDVVIRMCEAYPELMIPVNEGEARLFPGVDRLPGLFNELPLPNGRLLGEDLSFCQRWRNIGGQVHGCAWFNVQHLGTYEFASDMRAIGHLKLPI